MTSQRGERMRWGLPAAVLILLLTSLTPARWLGLTREIAAIINVPFAPIQEFGNVLAITLRPPSRDVDDLPEAARAVVRQLERERDQYERLFRAAEARNAELREQLRQIQMVPVGGDATDVLRLNAPITARSPADPDGAVRVRRGRREGVEVDAVAIYAGVHLLGRVIEVDLLSSTIRPVMHESTGALTAVVAPAERTDLPLEAFPRIRIRPVDGGGFVGDIDRAAEVAVGDLVCLYDRSWPEVAQFRHLGIVEAIRPKPEQPLRNTLEIRPRYRLRDVRSVVLIVERPEP